MREYRVLLKQTFVVPANSAEEARVTALKDLADLLRDGWFIPKDVEIIEELDREWVA